MPYAPQTQYRGDQYLFQGISSAGKSIGDTIAALGQQHKEARGYQSLLKAVAPQLGLKPEDIDNMSLEEAKGKLQAMAVKKTLGDLGLQDAEHDNILQQIQQRTAQVKAGKTFQDAVAKYIQPQANLTAPPGELYSRIAGAAGGGPSPVTTMPGAQLDPQTALRLGIQSGMDPDRAATLADAISRIKAQGDDGRFSFDPSKGVVALPGLPGRSFVQTSRGGGQILEDPVAIAADAKAKQGAKPSARFKAVPSLTDPSGWATSVEADSPEDLKSALELMKQAQGGGGPPKGGTPNGPIPLPGDRSQWQKGQQYNFTTKSGQAASGVWDGSQFTQAQ